LMRTVVIKIYNIIWSRFTLWWIVSHSKIGKNLNLSPRNMDFGIIR
jgi:hypothetical protein